MSKNGIIKQMKQGFDNADAWGSVMCMFFPVAIEMDIRGLTIPHEWGYRAGCGGPTHDDDNDFYTSIIQDAENATLEQAGRILNRYCDILKAHKKDY